MIEPAFRQVAVYCADRQPLSDSNLCPILY